MEKEQSDRKKMELYEKMLQEEQLENNKKKPRKKIDYDFRTLTSCVSLNVHLAQLQSDSQNTNNQERNFDDLDQELLGNQEEGTPINSQKIAKIERKRLLQRAYSK